VILGLFGDARSDTGSLGIVVSLALAALRGRVERG